jgi:hypothetical protein
VAFIVWIYATWREFSAIEKVLVTTIEVITVPELPVRKRRRRKF